MFKRVLTLIICSVVILSNIAAAKLPAGDEAAQYLYKTVTHPVFGTVGGEWTILGIARSSMEIPDEYFDNYYTNIESFTEKCGGVIHERKLTEYSRLITALTAIGKDPRNVAGYNLLTPLGDYEKVVWQGINGPVWALIALDCGGYEMPVCEGAEVQATREMYVEYILNNRNSDGGWSLTGDVSDADITGMVLQALSNYRSNPDVEAAIEKALEAELSYTSSESHVQMTVAKCELGIAPDLSVFDDYHTADGGFSHYSDDKEADIMSTEQCVYALVAADRLANGKNSLFDMSDVTAKEQDAKEALPLKTFADIDGYEYRREIETLAAHGIINGKTEQLFEPYATMTRAEFAAVMVRGLGLEKDESNNFRDVSNTDWFFADVNAAFKNGIVKGMSETQFNPYGTITREQAAVMIVRGAGYLGVKTNMEDYAVRNALAGFIDYTTVADWSKEALAYCYAFGILPDDALEIKPAEEVTRGEIAMMLCNMLTIGGFRK